MNYIQVGPKSHLKCPCKGEAENNQKQTQTQKRGGGMTKTDTGVMWSQVKEC